MFTIADAIEAFEYPGVTFDYVQLINSAPAVVLIATCTTACTRNPEEDFVLRRARTVDFQGYPSLEAATRSLRSLVLYLEAHEADERILVNGERMFDPHTWDETPTP